MRIIKTIQLSVFSLFLALSVLVAFPTHIFAAAPTASTTACPPGNEILTMIPTWYQFLPCDSITHKPVFPSSTGDSFNLQGILLVIMAVVTLLMRIASILAIIFVVVGGIKYTTSQGNPQGLENAKNTITYAVIGLLLTILASGIVSFIARSIPA